jgi:predicted metalloprotease with PDZ domain
VREGSDPAVVTEVERDSPAWKAGVVAGDVLVAANGVRVTAKDLSDKLSLAKAGPIKLHLFRRDELRQLDINPLLQPKGKAKIKALDKPTADEKTLNAAWLGMAWPKEEPAKK